MRKYINSIFEYLAKKADEVEVFGVFSKSLDIEIKEGEIDTINTSSKKGIGIRVIKEGKMGFTFLIPTLKESFSEFLEKFIESVSFLEKDSANQFPSPEKLPDISCYDENLEKIPLEEKIEKAKLLEKKAKEFDRRITKVRYASYKDTIGEIFIKNSRGIDYSYKFSICSGFIMVISENKLGSESAYSFDQSRYFDKLKIEEIANEASKEAVYLLGAKSIPSRRIDIILKPKVAIEFLGLLSYSFSADAVYKGKSLLKDKLGERIFPKHINIIDDGTLKDGLGSSPFDDEGTPKRKTILVKNGVIKNFLTNIYTANKLNIKSTANALRSSFKSPPKVGVSNFYLEKGSEDVLSSSNEAFLIFDVMGMHTADPISGDFSVGATGVLVKNGRILHPIRSVTIADNIIEFFKKIEKIGNDLRFFGSLGSPSILIKDVTLSGE